MSIFERSETNNLRILQQIIWDFERLFEVLESKHRENDDAMRSILGLFFALSFDIKSGSLNREDLTARNNTFYFPPKNGQQQELPPIMKTRKRYADIDIASRMISNETLIDFLIDGFIDSAAIINDLNSSVYFVKTSDEPAWKTVWHGYERSDEDFNEAVVSFEEQFVKRHFEILGEVYHAFGLRFWLSKIGHLAQDSNTILDECIGYVDDLYSSGRLPSDYEYGLGAIQGYEGLGVYEAETPNFKKLMLYLNEKIAESKENSYPTIAARVLDIISNRPQEAFAAMALVDGGENLYYNIPFWPSITAVDFAARLLALSGADQRAVFIAIQGRYDHAIFARELAPEKPWLQEVRTALLDAAKTMSPIARSRTESYVRFSIDKILNS